MWLRYWSCFRHSNKSGYCSLYIQFYKLLWLWFHVAFFLNSEFITMMYSIDINDIHTITGSIYDGITRRASVSNVGIESVCLAGQAGFTYQVLV